MRAHGSDTSTSYSHAEARRHAPSALLSACSASPRAIEGPQGPRLSIQLRELGGDPGMELSRAVARQLEELRGEALLANHLGALEHLLLVLLGGLAARQN